MRESWAAWLVVLVGVLSHPAAMLVGYAGSGLPGGPPSFPSADGCADELASGSRVRVVVGYADSYSEAMTLRDRARAAGLAAAETRQDGCGRVRVFVDDVPSMAAARTEVVKARAAGLTPTLESDLDD